MKGRTGVVSEEELVVGSGEVEDGGGVSHHSHEGDEGEEERDARVVEDGIGHERAVTLLQQLPSRVIQRRVAIIYQTHIHTFVHIHFPKLNTGNAATHKEVTIIIL